MPGSMSKVHPFLPISTERRDMTAIALAYVGCGAVIAAFYNVLLKRILNDDWKKRPSLLVFLTQGASSLLFFAIAAATGGPQVTDGFWWPAVASGLLNVGIQMGGMLARALEDVSLVSPIMATTPALVIFTSMVLLGEFPTTTGWIGIWVMVIGTYSLNIEDVRAALERRTGAGAERSGLKKTLLLWLAPFRALGRSAGVRWAFFAAMLSTISLNYDGVTARRANVAFASAVIFGLSAVGNAVIAARRGECAGFPPAGKVLRVALLPAALFTAFNWVTNQAYRETIVPYVGTLKRLQIPLTIILAFFLLKERKSFRDRLVGGILLAVGAALIAWK